MISLFFHDNPVADSALTAEDYHIWEVTATTIRFFLSFALRNRSCKGARAVMQWMRKPR